MSSQPKLSDLTRDGLNSLPLYATDSAVCAIDLSDNTNMWGAPPAAVDTLRAAAGSALSRYPSLYSEPLRDQLVEYVGLQDADNIDTVTGCGSDDVLDSAMRAFAAEGASIAFSSPTFSMIPVLARLNSLRPVTIPFLPDMDIDAQQLVDARAQVTYLCSPNNPTGSPASRAAIEFVVRNASGVVILDEAYAEFASETFVDLVRTSERLLIARTFSKAFGLAGLRVGFGVASRELTHIVARARGPYKVTSVAESAVRAALSMSEQGQEWVQEHARLAGENRDRFVEALRERGISTLPSAANFVLALVPRAVEVSRGLVSRGIRVRVISGLPSELGGFVVDANTALRIGVGPWPMMAALLDALEPVR